MVTKPIQARRSVKPSLQGIEPLVDGRPCRLFRFSGYTPDDPQFLTKYSRRLTRENAGPAGIVFDRFGSDLEAAGYRVTKEWPYAYAAFDNGVPVPEIARSAYMALGDEVGMFGDPLRSAAPGSFFRWLNEPVDLPPGGPRRVTRLWHLVYRARPDLQRALPDPLGVDRDAFLDWTVLFGLQEHAISDRFVHVPSVAAPGR